MTWEETVYEKSRWLDNWISGDKAEDIGTTLQGLGVYLSTGDCFVRWNENGYEYITWGDPGDIQGYICYRRRHKIRWFKRENA